MPELLFEGPLNYISYIKAMIKMIGKTIQGQDKISLGKKAENQIDDYELVLQKAECDIKRHIRVSYITKPSWGGVDSFWRNRV